METIKVNLINNILSILGGFMNHIKCAVTLLTLSAALLLLPGCSSNIQENKNTPFSQGGVAMAIKKGVTTQTDVLEKFGSPNIVTNDASGDEVWTYQKSNMTTQSHGGDFGATIILIGGGTQNSEFKQSSKTATLIIKFGTDKKIKDFKFMSSDF